jgi:hypothetical protein
MRSAQRPTVALDREWTWKEVDGAWNLVRVRPNGDEQQLTRTLSAAWQPAPTPDGTAVYYVQLTATGCEIRKLDLTQPALDPISLDRPEDLMAPGAILSLPDSRSLLPPPVETMTEVNDYSVWSTHRFGLRGGFTGGPYSNSLLYGLGGTDLLGRLNWYAVGATSKLSPWADSGMGPSGGGLGIAWRGWSWAPSVQAFVGEDTPSLQRHAPIEGLDRKRLGAEFALTWQQQDLSPLTIRPFVAWERVTSTAPDAEGVNRALAGASVTMGAQRVGDTWGAGVSAAVQGAVGHTQASDAGNWTLTRLKARLGLRTPLGRLAISAEEGMVKGEASTLDTFFLGGMNTGLVPSGLDLNNVRQPALPAYLVSGDRMRMLRAEYGRVAYLYFEKAAVWRSTGETSRDYQDVIGAEIRLGDIRVSPATRFMSVDIPALSFGVHRPLTGLMKNQTKGGLVWTLNWTMRL